MKPQIRCFALAFLTCLIIPNLCGAQKTAKKPVAANPEVTTKKTVEPATPEEILVRAAYEKVTRLNRASFNNPYQLTEPPTEESILRFELTNFRVGPIQDIM